MWVHRKTSAAPSSSSKQNSAAATPSRNVAKIWKWLESHPPENPVLLIQAFSKYYDSSSPQVHKETASFLGQQMCKAREDIRYIPLDMDYQPGSGNTVKGAGRRTQHAYELAEDVACRVREELAATSAAGRSSVCSPGSAPTTASSLAGSFTSTTSSAWFSSPALCSWSVVCNHVSGWF